jgi:hypothetical protein
LKEGVDQNRNEEKRTNIEGGFQWNKAQKATNAKEKKINVHAVVSNPKRERKNESITIVVALTHSFVHTLAHSFIHSSIHSFVHSLTHSLSQAGVVCDCLNGMCTSIEQELTGSNSYYVCGLRPQTNPSSSPPPPS